MYHNANPLDASLCSKPTSADFSAGGNPTKLFGMALVNAKRTETSRAIALSAANGIPMVVNFVNAHCVNVAARDAGYAKVLQGSDILLPDGSGIRIAAQLAGQEMGENLNGTDIFPDLCAHAARYRLPIYLLGGEPGVAFEAARKMKQQFPALVVAGTHHGFFAADKDCSVVDEINRSGAAMLFVGFGVPRQEKWIAEHREKLVPPVLFGVGGLFDYYSGRVPRAPLALRRMGSEWVWRLWQEPARLANRYLIGNCLFLGRAVAHALVRRGLESWASATTKRALDLVATSLGLMALTPVIAAIAAAIKLEDGGPVFFRQVRVGAGGRPFTMLKFRSMVVNAEALRGALLQHSERDGTCFKMKRDPRITKVGALLRRFSLDELPQLFNVFMGDMSLVGPRPALPAEVITYQDKSWGRLRGKPGITCIWQVSGRADIPFAQQVEMDIDYLSRKGLLTDLTLLVKTVPAVLSGRGAY